MNNDSIIKDFLKFCFFFWNEVFKEKRIILIMNTRKILARALLVS